MAQWNPYAFSKCRYPAFNFSSSFSCGTANAAAEISFLHSSGVSEEKWTERCAYNILSVGPWACAWGGVVEGSGDLQYFSTWVRCLLPQESTQKAGETSLADNTSPSSSSGTGHKRQEGSHNLKIKFTHKHSANVLVLMRGLMASYPKLHPIVLNSHVDIQTP